MLACSHEKQPLVVVDSGNFGPFSLRKGQIGFIIDHLNGFFDPLVIRFWRLDVEIRLSEENHCSNLVLPHLEKKFVHMWFNRYCLNHFRRENIIKSSIELLHFYSLEFLKESKNDWPQVFSHCYRVFFNHLN